MCNPKPNPHLLIKPSSYYHFRLFYSLNPVHTYINRANVLLLLYCLLRMIIIVIQPMRMCNRYMIGKGEEKEI